MIDASKSPLPAWKRYGIMVLLAVFIAVAGYMIWNKELHHSSSNSSSPPAPTAPPILTPPPAKAVPTTIPGGIPVSTRSPFG